MYSPKEFLLIADKEGWAVPHFNFANLETLKAIIESAKELNSPVFVATSEGEGKFVGLGQAVSLVNSYKKDWPVFLNSDHTQDFERAKQAIDAGYDMVLFDGSKLPFTENKQKTKEIVDYAKTQDREILVEGELGYLRGRSEVLTERVIIDEEDLTKPDEAREFVEETKVDILAIAIGNIHGIQAGNVLNPHLDIKRLIEINQAVDSFLVLHGGSGTPVEDIKESIRQGINIIHINTEIRVAYANSLRKSLAENPDIIVPYKIFLSVIEAMKEVIKEKIKNCGSEGKVSEDV